MVVSNTNMASSTPLLNIVVKVKYFKLYFQAPETGSFTFDVSGDDQCQLSISTDETPENLKLYVLFPNGMATNVKQFDKYVYIY